ncbi:MAG: Holliday junction resolvase RecU [Aerococcus sp.]|nr:Holliday junction resolvase RecU [Aerococcus sp.]
MRYPNGKVYQAPQQKSPKKTTPVRYGKRGMHLEEMLNDSNDWYRLNGRAVIHKKPTPIQVVGVNYPSRAKVRITEAYYRQASTTDYNGVYRGYYLDFEAKQTKQKTRFPLNNFHDHQIQHMTECVKQDGICFAIILFSEQNEAYLYPFAMLKEDWQAYQNKEMASIPYQRIHDGGFAIDLSWHPKLRYLDAVDQYIQTLTKNKGSERCE